MLKLRYQDRQTALDQETSRKWEIAYWLEILNFWIIPYILFMEGENIFDSGAAMLFIGLITFVFLFRVAMFAGIMSISEKTFLGPVFFRPQVQFLRHGLVTFLIMSFSFYVVPVIIAVLLAIVPSILYAQVANAWKKTWPAISTHPQQ